MRRAAILVASFVVMGTVAFAHGENEHVRGVVTALAPQSVTVQTVEKTTKTLTLTDKTTFQSAGKPARLSDLKVGDRVVIDVPAKTSTALLIQIGAAPAAAAKGAASGARTFNGRISDGMCGAEHHAGMQARACADMCVKQGVSYVLVAGGKVYQLDGAAKTIAAHSGHAVSLTGQVQGDTIKVARIEMPKKG